MVAAYPGNMSNRGRPPRGANGSDMDERSPPRRRSAAPSKTRRARKPANAKTEQTGRTSAFAQAADAVSGATKRAPEPAKPAQAKTEPAAAAPKPAEASRAAPLVPVVNIEHFANNLARLIEESGKAAAAYLKPREEGQVKGEGKQIVEWVKTLGQVAEYWLGDPQRALELQTSVGKTYLDLWASAMRRMAGEPSQPVAEADPKDRRFADPQWSSNQFLDFLKQAYLLTTNWAQRLVEDAEGLDPHTRQKAEFYVRQIANAVSPSNFVLTNPELLRETWSSNAENLVRGMRMLAEDIEAGGGHLKI